MQFQDIMAIEDPVEQRHWIDRLDPFSRRRFYSWRRRVLENERKQRKQRPTRKETNGAHVATS